MAWTEITGIPAGTTSYQITGLSPGTTYEWRIKAVGDGVSYTDSDWSATQTVTTTASLADLAVAASFAGGTEAMTATISTADASLPVAAAFAGGTETMTATISIADASLPVAAAFAGGTETMTATISTSVIDAQVAASFSGGTEAMAATISLTVIDAQIAAAFGGGAETMTAPISTSIDDLAVAAAFAGGTEAMATTISTSVVDADVTASFAGGSETMAATLTSEEVVTNSYFVLDTDFNVTATEAKAGTVSTGTQWDNQTWTGSPYLAMVFPTSLGTPSEWRYYPTATPNTHNQSAALYTLTTTLDIDGEDYTVMITLLPTPFPTGSAGQTLQLVF